MVQDFGFPYNGMGYPIENFVTHELQRLARVKDEFSVAESYPKFLELLNCSPTSSVEDLPLNPYNSSNYMKNHDHDHHPQISYPNNNNSNNQNFLLASISNGFQMKGGQLINNNHQDCSNIGTFSQIFPTTTIPSLISQSTTSSSSSSSSAISCSSFDINCLPALDHFGSPRFDRSFSHHSSLNAPNIGGPPYRFDHLHQPNHRPSVCTSKISSVVVSTTTKSSTDQSAKRPASNYIDVKPTQTTVAPKKTKSEPRSASAPFQVRKEKLGDRIAAIQQLVAPFGKTDTASVLMEAIGYIKFLQTQVETLSVPYMKSTDHEIGGISSEGGRMNDGSREAKRDLRSRGLCLVPLSCLSYVTDGGEGIWSSS
nr:transcription factor bHLH110-like isoform X2 [Erigeron canadensis]XP_043615491.1 transcription factor bHLH110-like isoform X2 [Erigeron canadensis]